MQQHSLNVPRTAHYYSLGQTGPQVRQFWLVCHGYGQLADAFLENFVPVGAPERLIVAPEGLNHAYVKGFDGAVGANWMTRHRREAEIADYAVYLQMLYDQYVRQLPPDVRIVLLGFSQGVATVCRWIMRRQPHFHDLVLWAGLPPEDLDYAAQQAYLGSKNLYLLYGANDPFLTPDRILSVQDIERKNGIDFGEHVFDGAHEIPAATLQDLLQRMG